VATGTIVFAMVKSGLHVHNMPDTRTMMVKLFNRVGCTVNGTLMEQVIIGADGT
jgi:hypothetical protein